MQITINVKKSISENAAYYYERGKRAKKKLEGTKEALRKSVERLDDVKKSVIKKAMERKEIKRRREWYEKFRWFISSEGILCIGGRDATTNEVIIKKHTGKDDLVFHTEISGSPFFVIKGAAGEKTIRESAIATNCFSRAWNQKVSSDVYYIKGEQVSKKAKSGEYLSKGAFMIYGKKLGYFRNDLELGIGLTEENAVMCGPVDAVKKNCLNCIILKPGEEKKSDVAKKIRFVIEKKFGNRIDLDEIMRVLPGDCKIS